MYTLAKFALEEDDAWRVVTDAGAGMFVATTPSGLVSVFVPVVVGADRTKIRTHVAKANPWWKSVNEGDEILALFVAASAYVSPSYYPSRLENPGVVPTWNYVAAEVRGRVSFHHDAEWKFDQVSSQTGTYEAGRSPVWTVEDAPSDFIQRQLTAIVGVEIDVTSIEGKAKLSQNRPDEDRESVARTLSQGTFGERNTASRMTND